MNWEKLATDPDLKLMWSEGRMARLLERIEKELIESTGLSTRERLWNQGFLAGLKFARQYPMIELDREREKKFAAVEREIEKKRRPFKALRFTG